MKRSIIGALIVLGTGLAAFAFVAAYTAIGRARGEEWGSLDGPAPVWPAVVGFGSLHLMLLGAVALVILVAVAILRAYVPRRGGRVR
ncbi:hypothetical protein ACL9RL_18110 [Plantibacter sp. Mn2098]|uniref:hypothetical protein n=1 Tax=Plantibacter sp. Mn2098 TaxID=3395266 RepID=UPI003BC54EA7